MPCETGNYWKCDIDECTPCPQGFYQPQWGQTSCWPCPYNTTTDADGATQPTDCKRKTLGVTVQSGADDNDKGKGEKLCHSRAARLAGVAWVLHSFSPFPVSNTVAPPCTSTIV